MLLHLQRHESVLLVGEGDFSFSLSLSKLLTTSLIATCLEDAVPDKYEHAQENINHLKQTGASVIYGVDATDIQSCDQLKDQHFDGIIFNFPHTGRKANITYNRELLKRFFISASQLLLPQGKIYITLCNGQGGTPADHPQREWCNSWQVVAMATYADLILIEANKFIAQEFPEYSCTGYRGRGKCFNTTGAITHVFVNNPLDRPFVASPTIWHHLSNGHQHTFHCPEDLDASITRNLLVETTSIVRDVYCRIIDTFKILFHGLQVHETSECEMIHGIANENIQPFMYTLKEQDSLYECCNDHKCVIHNAQSTNYEETKCSFRNCTSVHQFILSPYVDFSEITPWDQTNKIAQVVVGRVFRRCAIRQELCPITHELVLVLPEGCRTTSPKEILSTLASVVRQKLELNIDSAESVEILLTRNISQLHVTPDCCPCKLHQQSSQQDACENDKEQYQFRPPSKVSECNIKTTLQQSPVLNNMLEQPLKNGPVIQGHRTLQQIWKRCIMESVVKRRESASDWKQVFEVVTASVNAKSYEIGLVGKIAKTINHEIIESSSSTTVSSTTVSSTTVSSTIGSSTIGSSTTDSKSNSTTTSSSSCTTGSSTTSSGIVTMILINLDLLTMLCYDIDDVRLLWSENSLGRVSSRGQEAPVHIPYSRYSPSYTRDLSFWVDYDVEYVEMQFFSVVRIYCAACVQAVHLIDTYNDPENPRCSLCYRFIYQSCDKALSRSKVNELHNDLSSKLETFLNIKVRA